MEIERLKMICVDAYEASYASKVYSSELKTNEEFEVIVLSYKGSFISQKYNRYGTPIGKPFIIC